MGNRQNIGIRSFAGFLKNIMQERLDGIITNYNSTENKDFTYLRALFRDESDGDFSYFDQAVGTLITNRDSNKALRLFFENETQELTFPSISFQESESSLDDHFFHRDRGYRRIGYDSSTNADILYNIGTGTWRTNIRIKILSNSYNEAILLRLLVITLLFDTESDLIYRYKQAYLTDIRWEYSPRLKEEQMTQQEQYKYIINCQYKHPMHFVDLDKKILNPNPNVEIDFNYRELL